MLQLIFEQFVIRSYRISKDYYSIQDINQFLKYYFLISHVEQSFSLFSFDWVITFCPSHILSEIPVKFFTFFQCAINCRYIVHLIKN